MSLFQITCLAFFSLCDSLNSVKLTPRRQPKMLQLVHQRVPVNPLSNPSPAKLHSSLLLAQQSLLRMRQLQQRYIKREVNYTHYCGNVILTNQPESQPIQTVHDVQVADDVVQPPKSSSKSSVKSKLSKTSLKSISGSIVSVKNETTTEVIQ